MKYYRILAVLWWLYLISGMISVYGQWQPSGYTHLGPKDGLTSYVLKIAQDQLGYIYCATGKGLIRYNGNTFTSFDHDTRDSTSIVPGAVTNVICSSDGMIWATTLYGALVRFDPRNNTIQQYMSPSLPYHYITVINGLWEDEEGAIWVGGHHFRLMRFDPAVEEFDVFTPEWIDPQKHGGRLAIFNILGDKRDPNKLWISVLDLTDPEDKSFYSTLVSFDKHQKTFTRHSGLGAIKYQDDNGILWAASHSPRLTSYDPETNICKIYQHHITMGTDEVALKVNNFFPMDGDLWVATTEGVLIFNKKSEEFTLLHGTENMSTINHIYRDRDDNIWIGGFEGLFLKDRHYDYIQFYSLEHLGVHERFWPARLCYDVEYENFYLLTTKPIFDKHAITQIPHEKTQLAHIEFYDEYINGIVIDGSDDIWVATKSGYVGHLDRKTKNISPQTIEGIDPFPWVWNLQINDHGIVFGSGSRSFIWFDPRTRQGHQIHKKDLIDPTGVGWMNNNFNGACPLDENKVCVYGKQLFQVDLETQDVKELKYDRSINPTNIGFSTITQDKQGHLWLGNEYFLGKFKLLDDSISLLRQYTTKDGLINQFASMLYCDHHDRTWIFSYGGLNCIDPDTDEIRYFGVNEGLPNTILNPLQIITLPDLSIATNVGNGIMVFHPDSLWSASIPPNAPVVLERIRVGSKTIQYNQFIDTTITLSHNSQNVDIKFQGIDFPTDAHIEYQYRLLGLSPEWISIGKNNLVTLPGLPPGFFIFEVKTGTLTSSSISQKLNIIVPKPLIKRWWFISIVALGVLLLLWMFYRWRINRIRRMTHERVLHNKKISELELRALRSQMNPHFMFNTLNSIKNYILLSEPRLAARYLANFAHLIRMILQQSREHHITLEQELETLQLYIRLEKLRFKNSFNFHCKVEDNIDLEHTYIPPMILQPFVENAIWHGLGIKKGDRNLWLSFEKTSAGIRCIVEDDGIGRKQAQQISQMKGFAHKSMGMSIIQDRVGLLNKNESQGINISIIDKMNGDGRSGGTRVEIIVPQQINSIN